MDTTPIRNTPEYKDAQLDERFRSWLLMQDAVMDLEFIIYDVPELESDLYTREGLVLAEAAALERFADPKKAFSSSNLTLAMRFVYFVGETLRRATDGTWVAVPRDTPPVGATQAIDVEFRAEFYDPIDMMKTALNQRTGDTIAAVYDKATDAHQKWLDAGRPPRPVTGEDR